MKDFDQIFFYATENELMTPFISQLDTQTNTYTHIIFDIANRLND